MIDKTEALRAKFKSNGASNKSIYPTAIDATRLKGRYRVSLNQEALNVIGALAIALITTLVTAIAQAYGHTMSLVPSAMVFVACIFWISLNIEDGRLMILRPSKIKNNPLLNQVSSSCYRELEAVDGSEFKAFADWIDNRWIQCDQFGVRLNTQSLEKDSFDTYLTIEAYLAAQTAMPRVLNQAFGEASIEQRNIAKLQLADLLRDVILEENARL